MNTKQRSLIIITLLSISTFISGCDVIFGGGGPAATEAARLQQDLLARAAQTANAAATLTQAAKPTNTSTLTNTPPPTSTLTSTPTSAPTSTFTPTPAPKAITVGMNQRAVIGNVAITVIAVKADGKTGRMNVYVPMDIENLGKEPLTYNFSNFMLTDSSNKTVVADPNIPFAKTGPGTIASGQKVSPVVTFNVTFEPSQLNALIYISPFGTVTVLLR